MKIGLAIAISALWLASGLQAGTIVGTVRAKGPDPKITDSEAGKYQSRRYKFAERIDYSRLRDFVVYIDQPMTNPPAASPAKPIKVVTQKDVTFLPHVLPVVVGTPVEWPNEDDIFHNVFSMSKKKEFNLGFYKGREAKPVIFDEPGRVDVFCAIHTKMHCIVLVLENPHFVVVDERGRFVIPNVPAGAYKLTAWHERLPSQTKEITVPEKAEVKVDFTLGLSELPKN